jgi:hypothetical protein
MSDRHSPDPGADRPRPEPEIISPERAGRTRGIWVSVDRQDGARRVYMPGPFTIILALAILGLIAVFVLIFLLSLAVIWIPVVIVLILAFVASMYWRRFRAWMARR